MEVLCGGTAGCRVVAPARDRPGHIGRKRKVGALKRDVVAIVEPRDSIALLGHRLHLLGDGIERFFPGDSHEMPLAGALLADAFHGVQQAVFGVQLLTPCMSHRTRTRLQHTRLHRVFIIVLTCNPWVYRVIGFDGNNLAVLDAAFDQASSIPAPVVMTRGVEVLDSFVSFA